jgi:hypothetical protein
MNVRFLRGMASVIVIAAISMMGTLVYGQGSNTSAISGVVVDTGGGVVPGATVTIKHAATGVVQTGVTNADGAFSFPGQNIGTYTVTVTLEGFKTFVVNDVVLTAGAPASVRAVLEVGGLSEQVVVSSSSEIVQTQSTVISSTINSNQIVKLPITSRSAMDFVTLLPGVTTAGGNRQSQINGLPQGVINITLDGVNIQDNTLRSTDGFFAVVSPRLDAIEEVTVTTATQEAGSGQGAVQIKFTTRSGTNDFTGSAYNYFRSDKLNANTWFNNRNDVDKVPLKQNQTGGRIGGPIIIPGLFDGRNKAFFFANYEEFRQPTGVTRNRNVLKSTAEQGIFTYTPTGGSPQTVNVLALAAANGHTSTPDPAISAILGDIRSAVSGGSLASIDDNLERYTFNVDTTSLRRYPTTRIDYNITDRHRFSNAFNYQYFTDSPDTLNNMDATFPGFPVQAGQKSERYSISNSLRSTLGANLVNEALVAWSGAPITFFGEITPGMYAGTSVAEQRGFRVTFPNTAGMNPVSANPTGAFNPQSRNASSLLIEDTVTALRGRHSLSMGASFTQYDLWLKNQQIVPNIALGIVNGDPAQSMFVAANFPGGSAAQLTAAQSLYAMLTGRVSQITGNAALSETSGEYEYLGNSVQRSRMRETGIFVQDSWRVRPDLTINAGLRYELQMPFTPRNNSYSTATLESFCGVSGTNPDTVCNLFQPGVMPGERPTFINFGEGTAAYETDYDNFAPSVGVAWTLKGSTGILGRIFGAQEGDSVVRGGFTRAFSREGMARFSDQFGANPGVTVNTPNRTADLGNLGALPLLFRESDRLGPAAFSTTPEYPFTEIVTGDVNLMDPNLQVPYADSWTVGLQRVLTRNIAVEARYVGTRSRDTWATLNFNEINIFENGFLDEFRLAQANLQANVANGFTNQGFRYRGPGTGTVPLPIMFAYFQGAGDPNNAASYTSTNFATNNTFLTPLAMFNPNPFGFANSLYTAANQRTNAAAAGLPANFFLANPDLLGGLDLVTNRGRTDYNALQLELRRRLSQGLQFNASYAFGNKQESTFRTHRRDVFMARDAGSPGDITHVFKLNAVYDLPFGQGRRFGGNVGGVLDRIIGGWAVSLVSRIQSGRLVEFGNVRMVGMSQDDLQDMFKLRFDDAGKKVWMLPQDVIDETIKAFSVSATSPTGYGAGGAPSGRYLAPANGPDCIEVDNGAGYGECGGRSLVIAGPMLQEHDISISKRVRLVGRSNFEFRLEMLNAFNHANFLPVSGIAAAQANQLPVGSTVGNYEVTGLNGINNARVIQLVSRINW